MRLMLMAILICSLSARWVGPRFFTPVDSVRVVPDGRYQIVDAERSYPIQRLSTLPNGLLDAGELRFGIVPLPSQQDRFLAWMEESEVPNNAETSYFLLERGSSREFRLFILSCRGSEVFFTQPARPGHSTIDDSDSCSISSRDQLIRAMTRLGAPPRSLAIRATRVD